MPKTSARLSRAVRSGCVLSVSQDETVCLVTWIFAARSSWVMPLRLRCFFDILRNFVHKLHRPFCWCAFILTLYIEEIKDFRSKTPATMCCDGVLVTKQKYQYLLTGRPYGWVTPTLRIPLLLTTQFYVHIHLSAYTFKKSTALLILSK